MAEWILNLIQAMGYAGIALLTFLENIFPPIPSEVIMPLVGYQVSRGEFRLWLAVLCGSAGTLVGTSLWYFAGRKVGRERVQQWMETYGHWLGIDIEDLYKARDWFERHQALVVFLGRLLPGVRTVISLPAGFASMPFGRFLFYSGLGTVIWTSALVYAGMVLGENYKRVDQFLEPVAWAIVGLVVALYVRVLLRGVAARRRPT
jgi:Uncharacterized membrane-associated protein